MSEDEQMDTVAYAANTTIYRKYKVGTTNIKKYRKKFNAYKFMMLHQQNEDVSNRRMEFF